MLPRSFLSASSLKNGLDDYPSAGTKRQRSSTDDIDSIDIDSASDSSIDSDTDFSDLYQSYSEAYLHNDINTLLSQIERKQSKQERIMKKTLALDISIKKDTVKLAKLTRLMLLKQQQQHLTDSPLSATSSSGKLKLPVKKERPRRVEHQHEAPLFHHTSIPPLPMSHPPPVSTPSRMTQNSTPSGIFNHDSSRAIRSNSSINNDLAYKDTFDVVMRQRQNVIKDAFDRKARRLLCNKIENITLPQDMEDLMVSCSLNGELQFWNGNDKQQIDKLDSGVIYKDTWVGDMCWTSPTTLTLIPSTRSGIENKESVVVLDLKSVNRNSVKGDIQTMAEIPHQKGFESITAVDAGYRGGSASKERISFVTAGNDKTVCLWNLTRSSRDDTYEEAIHQLDIKHTNKVPALCFDKNRNRLYTGGLDQRFFIFDLETSRVTNQLNLGASMYNIQTNSASPNHLLITFGKQSNQFVIFDQRESHTSGIKLTFGSSDADKVDGHAKPDWHKDGNIVLFGSTTSPRLNFWDIRYANVSNGPSYSISLESDTGRGGLRVLQSVFFPNRNTIASVTNGRSLFWMDYTLGANCKPSTVL